MKRCPERRVPKADEFLGWFDLLGVSPIMPSEMNELHEKYIPVPKLKSSLDRGNTLKIDDEIEGFYAFRRKWIQNRVSNITDAVLVEQVSDEMSPTINPKDFVLVDRGDKQQIPGRIYLIRIGSYLAIRRLDLGVGFATFSPDNGKYKPLPADTGVTEQPVIMGRVIWLAREL